MHYSRWRAHGDLSMVLYIRGDDRARLESHIDRSAGPDACHPWTAGGDENGYGRVHMTSADTGKTGKPAHLALWELENGPVPFGTDLDHECHNQAVRDGTCKPGICAHRRCCNLSHLVPRTRSEHAAATYYPPRRMTVATRKLTEEQAREILALMKKPWPARPGDREIARRFGISRSQVRRIARGESWAWLSDAA